MAMAASIDVRGEWGVDAGEAAVPRSRRSGGVRRGVEPIVDFAHEYAHIQVECLPERNAKHCCRARSTC